MENMHNRCAVWGTNCVGQQAVKIATGFGYEVVAYCRSTLPEESRQIHGIPIVEPEELKRLYDQRKIDHIIVGIRNPVYAEEVAETISKIFPNNISMIALDEIENKYLEKILKNIQYCWNIDIKKHTEIWIKNFMTEVEYWVQNVAKSSGAYHWDYLRCLENSCFNGIFETPDEILETLGSDSVVMDIGCGLLSKYGNRLPNGQEVQLLAVDPLAAFYNRINERYAGRPYQTVCFGLFEFIANFYQENYCDLILINNALDHCINPFKSIVECLYILKKGGTICLSHRRAEALYEAYQGLHKWNIDCDKHGNFSIWNLENAICVSYELREFCDIQVIPPASNVPRANQWIKVYIRKTKDIPLERFVDMDKERYNLAFFIGQLMDRMSDSMDDYLQ